MTRLDFLSLMMLAPTAPNLHSARIVYARRVGDRWHLHVMKADGSEDRRLPSPYEASSFPAWSPDGKRIAFQAGSWVPTNHLEVCIMNSDGIDLTTLLIPKPARSAYTYASVPSWSPDGQSITFHCGGGVTRDVYISAVTGEGAKQLNPPGAKGDHSFWMPDGRRVGYRKQAGGHWSIVTCEPDGSGEETLVPAVPGRIPTAGTSGISPDGRRLLYAAQPNLHMLDVIDKSDRTIPLHDARSNVDMRGIHPDWFRMPAWARDGSSYLMSLPTTTGVGIFRISPDGKKRTRLTPRGADCFMPNESAA